MARLIDAYAAAEAVCYNCMDKYDCQERCSDYMEVFNIPTVDAAPVVHGQWINMKENLYDIKCYTASCSQCKRRVRFFVKDHCPNCGAKMDGDSYK